MSKATTLAPPQLDEPTPVREWKGVPGDKVSRLRLREPIQINNMGAREIRIRLTGGAGRLSSMSDIKEVASITLCPAGYMVTAVEDDRHKASKADFEPRFLVPQSMVQFAVPLESE